jgi:polar amino acid transport system substrate-binding protein
MLDPSRSPFRPAALALASAALAAAALALAAGCSSSGTTATTAAGPGNPGKQPAVKVSSGALSQPGTIRYCSDISSPPLEFYANGTEPTGSDVSLGNAIAAEVGARPVWVNTAFSGLIPALQAGHCDAIISQLFDKPARRAVVNFVDYMYSSEAVLVRGGNPLHISGIAGLCGHKIAAETGTTVTSLLSAQNASCTAHGKPPISVQTFLRDSDALEQLGLGHVDAYGTTVETGSYDMSKSSGQFQFTGPPFGQILTGIATPKTNTALHDAIAQAFALLRRDGTYRQIMARWHLQPDMLK